MAGVTPTTVGQGNTVTWGLGWATIFFVLLITSGIRSTSRLSLAFAGLILIAVAFDTAAHKTFLTDITNTWQAGLQGNFSKLFQGSATSGAKPAPTPPSNKVTPK